MLLFLFLAAFWILTASVMRRDTSLQSDRVAARIRLLGFLRSALEEVFWEIDHPVRSSAAGGPASLKERLAQESDPLGVTCRFEPVLSREDGREAGDITLEPVQFRVRQFKASAAVPQGLAELTARGRIRVGSITLDLSMHQVRRFWIYASGSSGQRLLIGEAVFPVESFVRFVEGES